jgi:pimeloyl-ACP methyl ester carboxylesterase
VVEQTAALETADGVQLHALLATVPDPSAVLVLCHGLTTDRDENGSFPALRDRAVKAGLAVARFDFRAHGRSGGTNEQLRLSGERLDAEAVAAWVQSELGATVPMIPLGVSFGGAGAVHLATTNPAAAGLVLWYAVIDFARNFGPDSEVPMTRLMRSSATATDPPWSGMPVVGTPYFFPQSLLDEFPGDHTHDQISSLELPVLAWYGSRDPFIDPAPITALASTNSNVDLRIARGAGHGFFTWRPWVIRQTVGWAASLAGR